LKKRFDVRILGQDLSVISDSGDEHVANVVGYVNEKMQAAGKSVANKEALNIAILAALNIADEYLQMAGAKENLRRQLESRSEQLIHLINDIR
jgi:cell division protein ZapA